MEKQKRYRVLDVVNTKGSQSIRISIRNFRYGNCVSRCVVLMKQHFLSFECGRDFVIYILKFSSNDAKYNHVIVLSFSR